MVSHSTTSHSHYLPCIRFFTCTNPEKPLPESLLTTKKNMLGEKQEQDCLIIYYVTSSDTQYVYKTS